MQNTIATHTVEIRDREGVWRQLGLNNGDVMEWTNHEDAIRVIWTMPPSVGARVRSDVPTCDSCWNHIQPRNAAGNVIGFDFWINCTD